VRDSTHRRGHGAPRDETKKKKIKKMKYGSKKQSYLDWDNGKEVKVSYFNEKGFRVFITLPTFWSAAEKLGELSEYSFDNAAASNAIRMAM
jgi:hypothetical protein